MLFKINMPTILLLGVPMDMTVELQWVRCVLLMGFHVLLDFLSILSNFHVDRNVKAQSGIKLNNQSSSLQIAEISQSKFILFIPSPVLFVQRQLPITDLILLLYFPSPFHSVYLFLQT